MRVGLHLHSTRLKQFFKNILFSGDKEPRKNRLLQSYDVLWIHVIDAICIKTLKELIGK